MAEHHFQPEGTECIPNLLMMAMHLVHLTKNLKIGCGFNIVPMWHPLRLAEDYAMADILSYGRVIFGVGRGYHTREVETFGAPLTDQAANRELFEEGVDVVFKAFNEERFSHKGKYYTLPPEVPYRGYTLKDLTLVPRPARLPVECWQPIQSGSARAFDFMAKHGISGVIGGGSAEGGAVERHMVEFQAAYARRGVELAIGERLSLGYQFFIAESREAAMAQAGKYYEENMKMFGELRLVRALTEQQIEANPVVPAARPATQKALISHRAQIARMHSSCVDFELAPGDVFVAWAPMFHMASTDWSVRCAMPGRQGDRNTRLRSGLNSAVETEYRWWLLVMPGNRPRI